VLIRTLHFEQASIIAAVLCSLIVAGFLKGIIGVGMPSRRAAAAVAVHRYQISGDATEHAFDLQQRCRRRWRAERLDDASCN